MLSQKGVRGHGSLRWGVGYSCKAKTGQNKGHFE